MTGSVEELFLDDWTVVPAANELRHRSGRTERIEARAMDVLVLLHERAGQVVSNEEILQSVWHGRTVSSHSIAIVVSALRKALGDDSKSPRYIETVPKRGYRLIAPTTPTNERGLRRGILAAVGLVLLIGGTLWFLDRDAAQSSAASVEVQNADELERLFLARQLWSRRDHDSVLQALDELERLLATNPESAAGHTLLAMIYAHKTGEHLGQPALDTFRLAQRHLDRARSLRSDHAETAIVQGLLDFYRGSSAGQCVPITREGARARS